jgi:protein TonB
MKNDYLEILFQERNKEYGAYELRTNYGKRVKFATVATLFLAVAFSVFATTKGKSTSVSPEKVAITEVTLREILTKKEKPKPEEPKAQRRAEAPAPQIETEKFTPPVIKEDSEVEKPLPPNESLGEVKISTEDRAGKKDSGTVEIPKPVDGNGIVEVPVTEEVIFEKVEIEASFPGGNAKWKQYLERNCNGQVATDNSAPEGTYTVVVQFVVDKEGNLSDVKALTAHGYGMEQEAIRVIRKGPKWNPAIQNGVSVKAYRKQLITFQVLGE